MKTKARFDPISGYQNLNKASTFQECKNQCEKYEWCRGVRVANPKMTIDKYCRLLTNHSSPIEGWTLYNNGNWAEPQEWNESPVYPTLRCLEKVKIGMLLMIESILSK